MFTKLRTLSTVGVKQAHTTCYGVSIQSQHVARNFARFSTHDGRRNNNNDRGTGNYDRNRGRQQFQPTIRPDDLGVAPASAAEHVFDGTLLDKEVFQRVTDDTTADEYAKLISEFSNKALKEEMNELDIDDDELELDLDEVTNKEKENILKGVDMGKLETFYSELPKAIRDLVGDDMHLLVGKKFNNDYEINTRGTRKRSVATIRTKKGSGNVIINGKRPHELFLADHIEEAFRPMFKLGHERDFDMEIVVRGGGLTGQAGAVRLAIARVMVEYIPIYRRALKPYGFLTRDKREVERKKPGQKKARKKFAWVKR